MGRKYQRTCKYCGGETNKEICRLCASHGKPTTKQDVLARFPQIRDIKIVASSRGHVTSISRIETLCVDCKRECSIEYKAFLKHPEGVRCQSCSARHGRKQVLVYPKDISDIEVVNQETLGGIGQLVEHTWIRFSCVSCKMPTETRYGSYRKGVRHCKGCAPKVPRSQDARKRMSDSKKELWKDPTYRALVNERRAQGMTPHSGKMSGPHKKLKQWLIENGRVNFLSEQWITNLIRVDELDPENKIVIEVNGDYFHANPNKYKANTLIRFSDKKKRTARDIWKRDAQREKRLNQLGYKVITIWEKEIETIGRGVLDRVPVF